LADDGDPLDALVYTRWKLTEGCVIKARPIGVVYMEDESGMDEKIICVPFNKLDKRYDKINDITDMPEQELDEIKHFFMVYKSLEGKDTSVEVFKDRKAAEEIIQRSLDKYHHDIEPRITAERKARGY
jgi:inorganic pyrophosphatase